MIAIGDISMLKPNSKSIPIDRDNDDIPIYLNKEYKFYIDIENKGRLNYTVKPLTFKMENDLLKEFNPILKKHLYKLNIIENNKLDKNAIANLINYNALTKNNIDNLIIKFSKCVNPEIILPKLRNINIVFLKEELEHNDYENLYYELLKINYYKNYNNNNPVKKWFHKMKNIKLLKNKNLDYIKYLFNIIVDKYTFAILEKQELFIKFKIINNILRYEREFKKKLLNLFLEENQPMLSNMGNLEGLILFSEKNADSMKNGNLIPGF